MIYAIIGIVIASTIGVMGMWLKIISMIPLNNAFMIDRFVIR